MNKIILTLVFMALWGTCKANTKMIEDIEQQPGKKYDFCFERFLKERLIRNEIILYRIANDSLHGVTKNIMNSGFTLILRSCSEEKCVKEKFESHRQFLINAKNAQELDYIMMKCICKWTSETDFIIMTPYTEEVFHLLKVLQKHVVPSNRATVVTFAENRLHYRRGLPRCNNNKYKNKTYTYDCLNSNTQVKIKVNVKDYLQCEVRYGVRIAPPYTFKPDAKQSSIMPGAEYLGIEIAILGEILRLPNVMKFKTSDINYFGTFDKTTGKRTGLLKELEEGRVDVLLGAIYIEDCAVAAEFTYPMFGSKLVAITGRQKVMNVFSVFTVFRLSLWLFILGIALALLLIIFHAMRRSRKLNIVTLTFYLLATLMGKSIPLNNKPFKLLLPMWIFLAIFLRICFEAQTVKRLTNRNSDEQIDDLYELCSKNFTIYVTELYYPFLRDGFNVSDCKLPRENIILDDDPLDRLFIEESNVATMMYVDHYISSLSKYVEIEQEEPFHVVEEVVKNIPFVYCYKHGDPIGFVLKYASTMFNRGFVQFFINTANMFRCITIGSLLRHKTKKLSLELGQMAPAFYLYFIGILVSIIALAGELIIAKLSKRSIR